MKPITQRTNQWEWWRHAIGSKLRLYLFAVLIVPIGFTGVSLGVWALGQDSIPLSNPFASFADVFPEQPRSAIEVRGFSCPASAYGGYPDAPTETCVLWPAAGAFSQVTVAVDRRVVYSLAFTLHENTLRVGDLMLLWGKPEILEYSRSVYLYWLSSGVTATATNSSGRFSLFLPVRRVIIAHAGVQLSLQLP